MRRKDEWDVLAEEIVDALQLANESGADEEVDVIATVLRRYHGAEPPAPLSGEAYAAMVRRSRITRGQP
jgi:hypothetical protein